MVTGDSATAELSPPGKRSTKRHRIAPQTLQKPLIRIAHLPRRQVRLEVKKRSRLDKAGV
jgi:hypothetical protein